MKTISPILLIESNDQDAKDIEHALGDIHIVNKLVRKTNYAGALDYLNDKDNPRPLVIILDINTLGQEAVDFINRAKIDDIINTIPVIALTQSLAEQDTAQNLSNLANSRMDKPADYKKFVEAVKKLPIYWLLANEASEASECSNKRELTKNAPGK